MPSRRWWWFSSAHGPSTGTVGVLGLFGAALAAALDPHAVEHGPPMCPSRLALGVPCPGCGMVRACVHLVHGDLAAMWHFNPFALALAAALAYILGLVASRWWRHQSMRSLGSLRGGPLLLVVAAAWAAWGVTRMVLTATGRWPSIV